MQHNRPRAAHYRIARKAAVRAALREGLSGLALETVANRATFAVREGYDVHSAVLVAKTLLHSMINQRTFP